MRAVVHLSLHTEFSITDGLVRVEALAERAREMGLPAVAVTDLGNLFGMLKFYKACRAEGVKPIVGLELEMREEARSYRLIVLATNQRGYHNLLKLASRSYIRSQDRGAFQKEWLDGQQILLLPIDLIRMDRWVRPAGVVSYFQDL